MINIRTGLTFDDVLLMPKYSEIQTRDNVDLSVYLGKNVKLQIPVVSANMKNVTGPTMAKTIAKLGGLAVLHRFFDDPVDDQIKTFKQIVSDNPEYKYHIATSVGVQKSDYEAVDLFVSSDVKIICVDVAHGDHKACHDIVKYISKNYPDVLLIAGNVATGDAAKRLADCGADVIKQGVGGGSVCSTRIETGNGVPQLTALSEAFKITTDYISYSDIKIIADGGIKNSGDITKSLCFSHCVMLGNLLAGTDEAPGDIITIDGHTYKQYAGSSTHKHKHIEGVVGLVPTKGPVKNVIEKLMQGLKSGCSYQGVNNLMDLKINPQFVSVSHAGLIESKPHDILLK